MAEDLYKFCAQCKTVSGISNFLVGEIEIMDDGTKFQHYSPRCRNCFEGKEKE